MIYKAFVEIILAISLVQIFPVDAGVVESYVKAADTETIETSFGAAMTAMRPSFPVAVDVARAPKKNNPESIGVITAATTALVMDSASGTVLYEKNAEEARSIGSMTKLMTALVFLSGNPDLNTTAIIESSDYREGGKQHIPAGQTVTIKDLLLASLISSDNTATAALARLSGFSEGDFVARMNEKAAEIGMLQTTFADPTGLSSENRSTAPDLVAMLRAALQNETIRFATEQAAATITDAEGNNYQLENTNELLTGFVNQEPYKIVGGKTGYLPEAGYCLGVEAQKDGGKDIFVVVLGSDSAAGRLRDVKALTVWTYNTFDW
ncbi:MAG: serine hydrolase [Patescibacteria group bacterium]|jgi:D-alanyl-D-alanine carboxypeptidase